MPGQTADISGFSTTDGTYTISGTVDTATAGKFTLTANAVPQKVCEKIKSYDWTLPVIIPGTCAETNNMTFTFNNDLSEGNASGQGETCAGVKCGDGCCSSGLACNNGQCCSTEKCCPSSQIPFCNAESSDGNCLEWSCGDAEGTLSDWAQPPSGTRYRISCPKGSKPYCTFAVAPGGNQAYCYEVQCCDGTVVDARTEALASGGGAEGSCQH